MRACVCVCAILVVVGVIGGDGGVVVAALNAKSRKLMCNWRAVVVVRLV